MSERIPAGGPFRALSGMHEALMLDMVREARRMLSIYCQDSGVFCEPYINLVSKTANAIAKIRLEDLMELKDYKGLDYSFFKTLHEMLRVYAEYIAGFLVTWNEYVVVQFTSDIEVEGFRYEKGEITTLPLHEAILLNAIGVVKLFRSIAFMNLERVRQS